MLVRENCSTDAIRILTFIGMANRLCFDIGLHLDCQYDGLSEKEAEIRHMTLLACVAYDR